MECLQNKVILITGASTGIGGHTAKMLSKFKPRLALVARSADKLKDVQTQCQEAGCGKGNVIAINADLVKHEDLARVVAETVKAFGQLDVLINNAAAIVMNDVETTTPEGFDRTMAVNIRAPFFLSQAAMPHLRKTKGCIINISSIAGQRPFMETAAYGISKAALEHFTRTLALELAPTGVRVNALTVGMTPTDTTEEMTKIMGVKSAYELSDMTQLQPLGGNCSMDDIAKVVTFLASDLSAAMTGTCLPVERGFLVVPPTKPAAMEKAMAPMKNIGDLNPTSTQERMDQLKKMIAPKTPADFSSKK
ncbi:uncharacterized oxidoreductase TM_0325-like [Littorina saxatilis]|uniref:Ketoreductase domain-containing protein n=1 Tax=Littorina saxatilis TaxID=31220 RepID=A0AAN9G0D5_9CAEN